MTDARGRLGRGVSREAERARAQANLESEGAPTPQEEQGVAAGMVGPEVVHHEDEILRRGANQQGEGRIP
jgi:hypothetical protein